MKNGPQMGANDPQIDANGFANGLKYWCAFVFLNLCAFPARAGQVWIVFISAVLSSPLHPAASVKRRTIYFPGLLTMPRCGKPFLRQ